MSSNLYWEPMAWEKQIVTDDVKFALRKRYSGSLNLEFGDYSIGYLQGLSDAGVKGANELIDAIDKHGCIQLTEVF